MYQPRRRAMSKQMRQKTVKYFPKDFFHRSQSVDPKRGKRAHRNPTQVKQENLISEETKESTFTNRSPQIKERSYQKFMRRIGAQSPEVGRPRNDHGQAIIHGFNMVHMSESVKDMQIKLPSIGGKDYSRDSLGSLRGAAQPPGQMLMRQQSMGLPQDTFKSVFQLNSYRE